MKRLCLVLAACGEPARAPVDNTAGTPIVITPARKFVLDGLGSELFGPERVYARANDRGEVVACVTEPETGSAFRTTCSILLADEAFMRLDAGLSVMLPDAARTIDRGEESPMTTRALADDFKRVRAHALPSSRALVRACEADGPVACSVLGAKAVVEANGHLALSFAGEIQGELNVCDGDAPRWPAHAVVRVDAPSRHVLIAASAPGCPLAGFLMAVP